MPDTLAQRIVRRRAELNLGANELARAIGKSHGFMVQLQNGGARPSEDTLRVILRVLDVPRVTPATGAGRGQSAQTLPRPVVARQPCDSASQMTKRPPSEDSGRSCEG